MDSLLSTSGQQLPNNHFVDPQVKRRVKFNRAQKFSLWRNQHTNLFLLQSRFFPMKRYCNVSNYVGIPFYIQRSAKHVFRAKAFFLYRIEEWSSAVQ